MRGRRPDPEGIASQKRAVRSKQKRPARRATRKVDAAPIEGAAIDADAGDGSASSSDGASDAPASKSKGPPAPAWLAGDGLTIWNRLAPTLESMKLLGAADLETFGRYCRNFARWLKLQGELDRDGETYETETYIGAAGVDAESGERRTNKLRRANPAFLIADRIERQLLATEDRFGLNPAERQRLYQARARVGAGDLFGDRTKPRDPATKPTAAAEPMPDDDSIHGFLGRQLQ